MSKLTKTIKCGLYKNKVCRRNGYTCEVYNNIFLSKKSLTCYIIKEQLNNMDVLLYRAGKLKIKVEEALFTGLNKYERLSMCYKKDK